MDDRSQSISETLPRIKTGDENAIREFWNRYFEPLKRVAFNRTNAKTRTIRDEEDLALSAIVAFERSLKDGRYATIQNRDDIWKILVTIVERKAIDHIRRLQTKKRAHNKETYVDSYVLDVPQSEHMNHELAVDLIDQMNLMFRKLKDPILIDVVQYKIEGFSNQDIAEKIDKSVTSVERKLRLAREIWAAEGHDI